MLIEKVVQLLGVSIGDASVLCKWFGSLIGHN